MSEILSKWKNGLARSSRKAFGQLADIFGGSEITQETWDDLEATLIQADLGLKTTQAVIGSLQNTVRKQGVIQSSGLRFLLEAELLSRLNPPCTLEFSTKPSVILFVGVNGSGKTTTLAKFAQILKRNEKKTLLVGADTFRAAAVDQLSVWAGRMNLPLVAGQANSDPGAVVYDGIQSAISKSYDFVLVDTAGRLHTRHNLMDELGKVHRVAAKTLPGAPHAVWLVLDATTGQNALMQARAFSETAFVSGIILAKLDTSAHGGMAFAIQEELGLPILYAGLGEQLDDLEPFDRQAFVSGILNLYG